MPTPNNKLKPIKNNPPIKRTSTIGFPDKELKNEAKYLPSTPNFKNPVVGETPANHDLFAAVAKPRPKSLSKNAQRKIKDK